MKKLLLIVFCFFSISLFGCEKNTTIQETNYTLTSTQGLETTTDVSSTEEIEFTSNDYCNCGYYQQRPFEISLSLNQILEELVSRGYEITDYTEDYFAYFPEDLLAIEARDSDWYSMVVKYESILTAYYQTEYGELSIDIYQMESSQMASDLAHAYFETGNCVSAVVIYSGDVIVKLFWYYESLMNEWGINPVC